MRLIDADKWINKLETQMNDKDCPLEIKDYNQLLINEINLEPTAHDVDKVIETLGKYKFQQSENEMLSDNGKWLVKRVIEECIKIAKSGGVAKE